ncbi:MULTISPECIES: plasmid recombination protein [unclassified Acidovorax]|uniref:plasmid recombination protein n=1 Tax=unclassified Acidovorax TaxID=2684926 RepID=UPI000B401328|nr:MULTISPECIES: plasmid recombination protein [unclassified Acidovorax]
MAGDVAYFAAKTIGMSKVNGRKPCDLLTAARHNLREIQAELGSVGRIDPGRSATNAILAGPAQAAEVKALAVSSLAAAGLNPAAMRRDHVQALEFVFSLPPSSGVDPAAYFTRCLAWLAQALPLPVLSAVSHADEVAPHLHVLLLPLADGVYAGGKPVERPKLLRLRESFFSVVAGPAGLQRESAKLRGEPKRWAVTAVLAHCEAMGLPAANGPLWPVLVAAIERDPTAAVRALGIELSAKNDGQTQAEPNPIGIEGATMSRKANPIGIEKQGEKIQSLSCVGFARSTPSKQHPPAIRSLAELWAVAGCSSHWKASRVDRLGIARAAQQRALARHASKPPRPSQAPTVHVGVDGLTRERDEHAHDLSAWD